MQLSSNGNNGRSNEAIRQPYLNFFSKSISKQCGEQTIHFAFFLSRIEVLNDKCVMLKEQKFENIDH